MRYTDEDIIDDLRRAIAASSLRKVAIEIGLSATFVSMVERELTPPGPTVAKHFGYADDGQRWIKVGRK